MLPEALEGRVSVPIAIGIGIKNSVPIDNQVYVLNSLLKCPLVNSCASYVLKIMPYASSGLPNSRKCLMCALIAESTVGYSMYFTLNS